MSLPLDSAAAASAAPISGAPWVADHSHLLTPGEVRSTREAGEGGVRSTREGIPSFRPTPPAPSVQLVKAAGMAHPTPRLEQVRSGEGILMRR